MIDLRLLISVVVVAGVAWCGVRVWATGAVGPSVLIDRSLSAVVAGVAVGRLSWVLIEQPALLRQPGDLLLIRSGVEFWPGIVAGLAWLAWRSRNAEGRLPVLAGCAPVLLIGIASYEATCVVRGECFGPFTSVGLLPRGLQHRQFPVGVLVAAVLAAGALTIPRAVRVHLVPSASLFLLATVKLTAAFFLPVLGTRPPRTQIESGVAALLSLLFLGWSQVGRRGAVGPTARSETRRPALPMQVPPS